MTDNLTLAERVEALSLGYADPPIGCTKERWWEALRAYTPQARYHAANLAAHDWDVLLIDGKLFLFQPRYGGDKGHWLSFDGSREDATAAQMRELYTRTKVRRFRSHGSGGEG